MQPEGKGKSGALIIFSVCLVLLSLGAMVAIVLSQDQFLIENPATHDAPAITMTRPENTETPAATETPHPEQTTAPDTSSGSSYGSSASFAPKEAAPREKAVLPTPAPDANQPVEPNEFVTIAKEAKLSVVGVSNRIRWLNSAGNMDDVEQANGSGVIVSADGYIVTNAHVVEDANSLSIVLDDGTEVDAVLIGADSVTDIAVLKIDMGGLVPIPIGNSDVVQAGDYVIAIGNPMGQSLYGTVTMGIVSSPKRILDIDMRRLEMMQTDAAINPGNSGGALINIRGELIGIASMKYTTTYAGEAVERIGFAVPVNIAMSIAQELIDKGVIERPALGISTEVLNEYRARYLDLPVGILVKHVYAGSPADRAGMLEGDVILAVNGEAIVKYEDLLSTLYAASFGDRISIEVYRNGEEMTLEAVLEQYEFPEE